MASGLLAMIARFFSREIDMLYVASKRLAFNILNTEL